MYNIGIDLGGTNIKVGVVNDAFQIIGKHAAKTGRFRSNDEIFNDICETVKLACDNCGISVEDVHSIGIGTPGVADRTTGIVVRSVNLGFNNTNLRKNLSGRIGREIYVENDANAAAYGEYLCGAAKGCSNVIVVTLGTGVGGGIIIDGKIYSGHNFCGGELGHTVIEFGGRICSCGRRGCFEAYASATALIKATKEAMLADKSSALWSVNSADSGEVDGKTAFDAMRIGDETASKVVEEYLNYLGCGIVNMINIFQPEILLIGGGICKEGNALLEPLREYLSNEGYCIDDKYLTKLGICSLGNDAGIIGAANLYRLG